MEASVACTLQRSLWNVSGKFERSPSGSVRFNARLRGNEKTPVLISAQLQPRRIPNPHRSVSLEASCSFNNFPAIPETGSFCAPFDEAFILKNKLQEIEPYLKGHSIYLVGMMGSGKTTVGQILSQVLSYSFCDRGGEDNLMIRSTFSNDSLVEQEVDGASVADIFQLYGEGFFRDKETEVLHRLSLRRHLVVSTGGGAVIRPINWNYMHKGISVWLDVPLEALAERIAAVGTSSRPLLHHESGDAYMKTLKRLSSLWEERVEAYANANARVSLENIAIKLGHRDVLSLTPTAIAVEALEQIEGYIKGRVVRWH